MSVRHVAITVLLLVAAPASAERAPAAPPVAVMAFKNLGGDKSLDWLGAGIADTMISDLRKSKLTVVERDQIDRALAELVRQGQGGVDESTAAKVGKLVGAKTIVLGGYQQAGKQLRINARFVSVETGVVLDAAKATGAAGDPFAVQDQIVAQLLGDAGAKTMPKRKASTKTTEAYKLYAQALTVATDADRRVLLKRSLEIDPDFSYASNQLALLEKRITGYRAADLTNRLADQAALRAIVLDEKKTPQERGQAAWKLLMSLQAGRQHYQLIKEVPRIYGKGLVAEGWGTIDELALIQLVTSLLAVKRYDQALQAAEQFIKNHPGAPAYTSAELYARQTLEELKAREKAVAKVEEMFTQIEAQASGNAARATTEAERTRAALERDFLRCNNLVYGKSYERGLTECRVMLQKWADHPDELAKRRTGECRSHEMRAIVELGDIPAAAPLAREIVEKYPEDWMGREAKQFLENVWPTDRPGDEI